MLPMPEQRNSLTAKAAAVLLYHVFTSLARPSKSLPFQSLTFWFHALLNQEIMCKKGREYRPPFLLCSLSLEGTLLFSLPSSIFFSQLIVLDWFLYIIYSVIFHLPHLLYQVLLLSRFGSIAKDSHEEGSQRQGERKEERQEIRGSYLSKTCRQQSKSCIATVKIQLGLIFNLSCS